MEEDGQKQEEVAKEATFDKKSEEGQESSDEIESESLLDEPLEEQGKESEVEKKFKELE